MKKLKCTILAVLAASVIGGCTGNDELMDDTSSKETMLEKAAEAYIRNTVLPTYKGMADAAIELYDRCVEMSRLHEEGRLTTAEIASTATAWKDSRRYWELSEAFLFGPAADHNIDPHIDSWPLDKDAMDNLLIAIRGGADYNIENNFGYGLLGFHAIEYMLFELSPDGLTSTLHSPVYTSEEMKYLLMVAEDLRNQCVCLEACWAGTENITPQKQEILDDNELDKSKNHGWMMINAGKPGSIYKAFQDVGEEIIQGCIDIADEVGNTKIGRPHSGSSLDDRNYIESPYSLNSIEDFQDNIRSIANSYCGSKNGDASISDYIRSVDQSLDEQTRDAIVKAIEKISMIQEPFAKNARGNDVAEAIEACNSLVGILEKVYSKLSD